MAWSTRLLRLLLRAYPRAFRERFGADLEADFAELLATRGRRAAWAYACSDLRRAVPMTLSDDQRARQRRYVVSLGGESPMGSLLFDVRHGVRALVHAPVFTAVTVLTLALGIGANSAIFSLVNAVLLRPLGYEDPERLMMIHEIIPESRVPRFGVSPTDYLDLVQYQTPSRTSASTVRGLRSSPGRAIPRASSSPRCRHRSFPCSASARPRAARSCRRRIRPSGRSSSSASRSGAAALPPHRRSASAS